MSIEARNGGTFSRPHESQLLDPEELNRRYTEIRTQMEDHQGELVLVVMSHKVQQGFDMPEDKITYGVRTNYHLGIVTEPFINQPNSKGNQLDIVEVSTPHYAADHSDKLIEKNISSFHTHHFDLGRTINQGHLYPVRPKLEIIAGDKEVAKWMENDIRVGSMEDAYSDIIKLHELDMYFDTHKLLTYKKMLNLLGRDDISLPDPPEKI